MSGLSDLSRLLDLRKLREERARTAVSIAASRLKEAEHAVSIADSEIEAHEHETGRQEERFFAAMGIRPVSENELGRSRDRLGISDQKREALSAERDAAIKAVAERGEELARAQAEWRQRLFERDKLAQAQDQLRQQDRARVDAAAELEMEDMSADRVRMSC